MDPAKEFSTTPKTNELSGEAASAIGKNLAKTKHQDEPVDVSKALMQHRISSLSTHTATLRPDHFSMYNGQVWFTPAGAILSPMQSTSPRQRARQLASADRRASSAPSGGSLDSVVHSPSWRRPHHYPGSRKATGQFFPNTQGYMENLAAMQQQHQGFELKPLELDRPAQSQSMLSRRHGRRKVAPASLDQSAGSRVPAKPPRLSVAASAGQVNEAFEHDLELGHEARSRRAARKRTDDSSSVRSEANSAGSVSSMNLDSDQELLGFDSSGTPIIATHTRAANLQPLVIGSASKRRPSLSRASVSRQGSPSKLAPPSDQVRPDKEPDSQESHKLPDQPSAGPTQADATSSNLPGSPKGRKPTQPATQDELMSELNGKLDRRRKASEASTESKVGAAEQQPRGTSSRAVSSADSAGSAGQMSTAPLEKSNLDGMKNGELLERQSIFALTYSGLATDKPPS